MDVPPEIQTALTKPEVISAVVTAILLALGAIGAVATWIKRTLDGKLSEIKADTAATRFQAENSHGPDGKDVNLREQVDRIEGVIIEVKTTTETITAELLDQGKKIDATSRKIDHIGGEAHDRIQAEAEERRHDVSLLHERIRNLRDDRI